MTSSILVSVAVALLFLSVADANVVLKPEMPLSMAFAQDNLHTALRTKAGLSKSFTGTYKGKFDQFGSIGTYKGGFSGVSKNKRTKGKFDGKVLGSCNMFGAKGEFSADYSGKFVSVIAPKIYSTKYDGRFDFSYNGKYAGKELFAKAVGTFSGHISKGKVFLKEGGKFHVRIAGKRVKGTYEGYYDGEKFGVSMRGTVDGKKFSIKSEVMLEGIEKMIKNTGSYVVKSGGKKFTGKFNAMDSFPSKKLPSCGL